MSVQHNTYAMFGAVLPYKGGAWGEDDDRLYDRLEPYMDSAFKTDDVNPRRGITVIFDGMNGEYIAVGRVFAKSKVYEGFGPQPIAMSADPDLLDMVRANIAETIQEAGYTGPDIAPGWHVLTHYR